MRMITILIFSLIFLSNIFGQVKIRDLPYSHGEIELQGKLIYDPLLKSIRSAVLVLPDMWGPDTQIVDNGMQLAQLGHIVMVADLYGEGKRIKDIQEAMDQAETFLETPGLIAERANAAMDMLKSQRKVDQGKIGVLGYGLGGKAAIELALGGTHIAALALYYPWLEIESDEMPDYRMIKSAMLVFYGAGDEQIADENLANIKNLFEQNNLDWQMVLYGGAAYGFTNKALGFEITEGMAFNYNANLWAYDKLRQFLNELLK